MTFLPGQCPKTMKNTVGMLPGAGPNGGRFLERVAPDFFGAGRYLGTGTPKKVGTKNGS